MKLSAHRAVAVVDVAKIASDLVLDAAAKAATGLNHCFTSMCDSARHMRRLGAAKRRKSGRRDAACYISWASQ